MSASKFEDPDADGQDMQDEPMSMAMFVDYARSLSLVWHMGRSGRAGRVLRYMTRSACRPIASARWASTVLSSAHMRNWSANSPRLLLRPHRPYLSRDYDFDLRCRSVRDHYSLASRLLQADAIRFLAQGKCLVLAALTGKGAETFNLTLRKTEKFDREGEFVLSIMAADDDRDIYSFVLTLGTEPAGMTLHVGCMQGPRGGDAKALVKHLTKALHGIRPRDLLADALYSLAEAWRIKILYGVCNRSRVFSGVRTHADYDNFWRGMGATVARNGFYLLPLSRQHHGLDEVPSHHRSEYRKRMTLRAAMHERILKVARFVMRDAGRLEERTSLPAMQPDSASLQPAFSFLRPEHATQHQS
jgi:uncharacterized protein VirK/YbjX